MTQDISEETAQDVELVLLRQLYEHVRTALRFDGIDHQRVKRAWGEMDMAVERVKLFDSGLMDAEDTHELLHGSGHISQIFKTCDAYESGYGHGLRRDGHNNADSELYADVRLNTAYQIGYRKGERLALAQRAEPGVLKREQLLQQEARELTQLDLEAGAANPPHGAGDERVASF